MKTNLSDISRQTTRPHDGFTLLEILVAITLLVIIVGVVYASFSTVINATEQARSASDEIRLRQFLTRQFQENFSSVYADVALINESNAFIGVSETSTRGSMDWVEFSAMSPLMGGLSPPGIVKRVRYAGGEGNDSSMQLGSLVGGGDEDYANGPQLEASEWLIEGSEVQEGNRSGFSFNEETESARFSDIDSPGWTVPISSIDFSFFDGAEWLEDWDSYAEGRLPWAVRVRINFAKSGAERESESDAGYDSNLDCDFEMVIPIPLGAGYFSTGDEWYGVDTNPRDQQDGSDDGGDNDGKGDNKGGRKGGADNQSKSKSAMDTGKG